ncbi:MAG TPA: apolipoprotein N-acyltransferase [Pseudomonadales bacterium]
MPSFASSSPLRLILAVLAGALAPLGFSPVDLWPLAVVSAAIFYVLLQNTSPRRGAQLAWSYGFGFFGVGASWVYVSIHDFGNAPPALAGVLTLLFVAGLALFTTLQGWIYRRFASSVYPVLGFAACWVLGEWFRSWFLTGFPWLYLGSAHVTTLLSGVAPIFGVFGISFVLALSAALLGECWLRYRRLPSMLALGHSHLPTAIALLWLAAIVPRNIGWVEASGTLDVALVQANIAQDLKFDPDELANNLRTYGELSEPLWGHDLIVWSETAVPQVYDADAPLVASLDEIARATGTALLTGIFGESDAGVHNSIVALGNGTGLWHKRKLVPFGEYTPLRTLSGSVLELFDLPMSSLVPGPPVQGLLTAAGHAVAPFICYEVVYPDFVRRQARNAELLVTISNDTWFGRSWGPPQHLQMAAMRARENGRYMVRATNNGISALINERGEIVASVPQFVATTLTGTVELFTGRTPWSRWGDWPLLVLCGLILLANFYQMRPPIPTAKS